MEIFSWNKRNVFVLRQISQATEYENGSKGSKMPLKMKNFSKIKSDLWLKGSVSFSFVKIAQKLYWSKKSSYVIRIYSGWSSEESQ